MGCHRPLLWFACGFGLILSAAGVPARAEIPADYKGTPFKGTPQVIPGRIEFENVDNGGVGVAFLHHNLANNASGADYRPNDQVPPICKTNAISVDTRTDGSPYPSTAQPTSYYVCQSHPGEWVRMTVDVKQAGTYHLYTAFASNIANISVSLGDNGADKIGKVSLAATADYHKWKSYDDFSMVTLPAGLQVLQFTTNLGGLQYDYLEFKIEGGPADAGAPPIDAGGTPPPDAAADSESHDAAGGTGGLSGTPDATAERGDDVVTSSGAGGASPDASVSPIGMSRSGGGCAAAGRQPGPGGELALVVMLLLALAGVARSR